MVKVITFCLRIQHIFIVLWLLFPTEVSHLAMVVGLSTDDPKDF